MRITIDRRALAQALADVVPFAPVKSPVLILKNVRITTKGNRVKIETYDTQASMRCYLETVEVDEDGSFLADCKDLATLIDKCNSNEVTLIAEDDTLTVKHSKGKARLPMSQVEEYPSFDMPAEDITEISVPGDILAEYVRTARNFVYPDNMKPQMMPIYAYTENGEFCCCATDTTKMYHTHIPVNIPADTNVNWYIEPFAFTAIAKAAKDCESVIVRITPTAVQYKCGNIIIQTVQTKGDYPDFRRVIPKSWNTECSVSVRELNDSLNRARLSCDNNALVKLNISDADMTVTAENLVAQKSSTETIAHNGCSEHLAIGLNILHLSLCLGACVSENVTFRIISPSHPIVLHSEDAPEATILIMPMRCE